MPTKPFTITFNLLSLTDLDRLTSALVMVFALPVTYALVGDLGAGKTAFVQSLARAYGLDQGVVSPTFTLLNHHDLGENHQLVHGDLYRLTHESEAAELGLMDYFTDSSTVVALEWADRFPLLVPATALWVDLMAIETKHVCRLTGLTQSQFLHLEGLFV